MDMMMTGKQATLSCLRVWIVRRRNVARVSRLSMVAVHVGIACCQKPDPYNPNMRITC